METRTLWLVRHGQASFGKSDYDNLSDLGHEQAYRLGQDLARRGVRPTRVISGSMKRHRQTLSEIGAGAGWQFVDASADVEAPAPDADESDDVLSAHATPHIPRGVDERWNELDHMALLAGFKPAYKNMLLLKADMVRTLRPRIAFEDTFEKAIDRWSSGEHDDEYPETQADFAARTEKALAEIKDGDDAQTLVVTSAGPVCWIAAHLTAAGRLDAWKHFTLAAFNTGVTRVTFDRHGARLLSFNEFSHLESSGGSKDMVTNR